MKIALTVWDDRISPVFDAAKTLLLVEIANGGIVEKRIAPLHPAGSLRMAEMLRQLDIDVLVCGAISEGYANRLALAGIELIPFVSGKTESILEALVREESIIPDFSMPGCQRHCRERMNRQSQTNNPGEVNQMPQKDGTGPTGQGPRSEKGSGQGKGRCRSESGTAPGTGPGAGQGAGQGAGKGSGRGENPARGKGRKGGGAGRGGGMQQR